MSHDTYKTSRIKSTMARTECVDDVKGAAIDDSASDNDNPCACRHVTRLNKRHVTRLPITITPVTVTTYESWHLTNLSVTRVCVT